MPNIAAVLKSEIQRIARKEIRSEVSALKQASAQYRAHIAALRRKVADLERALRKAQRHGARAFEVGQEEGAALRFRASGLASHRKRLGLSAADFGRLIGVSGQTVYKWEQGAAKPRRSQMEAIAAVRRLGKREAANRLSAG